MVPQKPQFRIVLTHDEFKKYFNDYFRLVQNRFKELERKGVFSKRAK